jgi:hypothetical protein
VIARRNSPCTPSGQAGDKPATNYGRLLKILERNLADAREPELIRRLREALRALVEEKSC